MAHANSNSANQSLSGPHGTIVSGIGPLPVPPAISASTSRQKSKAYNSSIAVGAEDVKYAAKYRDLKRKVKDIENDNDKLLFKVLQAKRNIQRTQLERAILYERLVAIPASPVPAHAAPPQHPNAHGPGTQPGPPPPAHANNGQWSQPPPPPHQHHPPPVQTVPYESRRHGTIQVIAGPDGQPARGPDGRVIPAPPPNLPHGPPGPGYGVEPHMQQSQSGRIQQQHLDSLPLPPHPQPQPQSSSRGHPGSQASGHGHPHSHSHHGHGSHGHDHEHSGSNPQSRSHSNQPHSYRENMERGHHQNGPQHRAPGPPPPLQPMMADSPPEPQPPRSRRHDISELTHSSSTSPHVHHAMPQNQSMPAPEHVSPPPARGHSHSSQSHSHSSMSPVEGRQHIRGFHRHQRIGPGANINQDRDRERERERERIPSPPFSRAPLDDDMGDNVNTSSSRSFHSDDRPRGADTARPHERHRSSGSRLSDIVNTEPVSKLPPSDAPSEQPLRAIAGDDMDVDTPGVPSGYGTGAAGFNPRDARSSRYAEQERGQSDSPHPSASGVPTSDAPANQDPLSSSHSQMHSGLPGSGEEASGSG